MLPFFLMLPYGGPEMPSLLLLGLPMPNEAALSLSVRVTAWTRCFALEAGSEGFGARSLRSSPTVRVCSGLLLREELSSSATPAYSMPSCPIEGRSTEVERSIDRPALRRDARGDLFRNGPGSFRRAGSKAVRVRAD